MTSRIAQWTLDVQDVELMAAFWSRVLGYEVDPDGTGSVHLRPSAGGEPTVWLQAGAGAKEGKNRDHPDLRTADWAAEVERVLALGARRADVGQRGDEGFTVLVDPEGNEFCILHQP